MAKQKKQPKQKILIVDPDEDFVGWATRHLKAPSVEIASVADADAAAAACAGGEVDLVLAELHLQPYSGLELLKRLRQSDPNAIVILTTSIPPTSAVIEAMRLGGHEFLGKGTLQFELRPVVEAALQSAEEIRNAADADDKMPVDLQESIIGSSPAMQSVFKMVGRVSRSDAPVLITGESGSGKEVIAKAIHRFSTRAGSDFVAINCAAIPDNLLESELFGHEKGSFTGATQRRVGRFEQCDGGTLFLDEIGDMPAQTQTKILRVLQDGSYSRVGGNETLYTDARVLAATHRDLEGEVAAGTFREDLFYRLNVVRIHIPPLRERAEDIAPLAEHFLRKIAGAKRSPQLRLTPGAIGRLEDYGWPGNVRELENTMQRACALAHTDVLLARDLPLPGDGDTEAIEPGDERVGDRLLHGAEEAGLAALEWAEGLLLRAALRRSEGDAATAAKLLGMTAAAFRKKASAHGLETA